MNRKRFWLLFVLALMLFSLSACDLPSKSSNAEDGSVDIAQQVNDALTSTAAFETAVAKALADAAPPTDTPLPPPTDTPVATDTPAATNTPEPTNTPEDTATPTLEPTPENPWVMQQWCLDHVGCGKLEIRNQTDSWAQITLTYLETGQQKFFTGAPKARSYITLQPGMYHYVFNFCGGEQYFEGDHTFNQNWYVVAKCNY